MKTYKVKIKNSDKATTVKANSELEAGLKFCEIKGLLYRVYASNIEVLLLKEAGNKRRVVDNRT